MVPVPTVILLHIKLKSNTIITVNMYACYFSTYTSATNHELILHEEIKNIFTYANIREFATHNYEFSTRTRG